MHNRQDAQVDMLLPPFAASSQRLDILAYRLARRYGLLMSMKEESTATGHDLRCPRWLESGVGLSEVEISELNE